MMFGGNNRAQVFFKQQGWHYAGRFEAEKYISRAAILYRQILAKEVASDYAAKVELPPQESSCVKREATGKKPIGAKTTGALGAWKLTTKPDGKLYEQTAEESSWSANSKSGIDSSLTTRFELEDELQSGGKSGGGTQVLSHVSPPKSSSSSSRVVLVEESDAARKRFLHAKSISSAQFFGDSAQSETTNEELLLKNDSSLVGNIVGKTKENLDSLAFAIKDAFFKMSSQDHVLYTLRRDLSDLMQIIYGKDADAIPFATRLRWVDDVCIRVRIATLGENAFREDQTDLVNGIRRDAHDLMEELRCRQKLLLREQQFFGNRID
ncbi:unnamed protein product [Microthlaspi erraticum]|nr:unnamed protein product [Microthlaspi erraticum]